MRGSTASTFIFHQENMWRVILLPFYLLWWHRALVLLHVLWCLLGAFGGPCLVVLARWPRALLA